ncbi:MAG: hypothetical protein IKD68_05985 [Solobacterium sp.]|nr:hypothetical protein [Solobacterium sp.]
MPQMRLHQTGHPGRLQLYLLRWLLLHVGLTDSRQLSFTYLNSPIQLDGYYEKGPDDSRILLIVPFIFLLIVISVCALLVGLNISKQAMNTPAAADHTQTSQTEPVRKPYVVYEAVFLDTSEITEVFRNIRGEKAPYELSPKDYHITFTFRPAFASYKLYGTKVTANGISYKAGDVIDDEGGTTQNEGILVNLQADNPEFKQLINSIHKHAWHITGSYSHKAKYTGDLDFSDAEPVMFTISGTFGAYLSDGTFRFIPEESAAFARPESNKAVGNPSEITLYL